MTPDEVATLQQMEDGFVMEFETKKERSTNRAFMSLLGLLVFSFVCWNLLLVTGYYGYKYASWLLNLL